MDERFVSSASEHMQDGGRRMHFFQGIQDDSNHSRPVAGRQLANDGSVDRLHLGLRVSASAANRLC